MIISVHLRKCAGTSFRSSLGHAYGDKVLFDYGDQIGSSWPQSLVRRQERLAAAKLRACALQDDFEVIHGHFFRRKYDFLDAPRRYITFLRDPVQRVVSNYHYLRRNPDRRNPDALIVNALGFSLVEFAQHPDNRNFQTQCLQSQTLEEFEFVGLVEDYEVSLRRLSEVLGVDLPVGAVENANAQAPDGYDLSPGERRAIEACNLEDQRLYDLARRRFDRLAA